MYKQPLISLGSLAGLIFFTLGNISGEQPSASNPAASPANNYTTTVLVKDGEVIRGCIKKIDPANETLSQVEDEWYRFWMLDQPICNANDGCQTKPAAECEKKEIQAAAPSQRYIVGGRQVYEMKTTVPQMMQTMEYTIGKPEYRVVNAGHEQPVDENAKKKDEIALGMIKLYIMLGNVEGAKELGEKVRDKNALLETLFEQANENAGKAIEYEQASLQHKMESGKEIPFGDHFSPASYRKTSLDILGWCKELL